MTKATQKTITMPCEAKFLSEAREMLNSVLAGADVSKREKEKIVLAVDEALSSIVTYADYKKTTQDVTIAIDIDDVRFKAVITDSQNVFDFNGGIADPERLAQERAHTMGVFLMRQIMDEIHYTYRKGFENQLELIKFL